MKKIIFTYFFLFSISVSLYSMANLDNDGDRDADKKEINAIAQSGAGNTQSSGFDRSKLVFGGNFGLQFGNGNTLINVAPQVGYAVSKYATLGTGIGYTYFRSKFFDRGEYDFRSSYLSFSLFGHFFPIENIIINVQPEISHMWRSVRLDGNKVGTDNRFVPILVLGGGVRYQNIIAMIQYDVVQNRYSPYGNSIFYTLGYTFSF